MDTFRRLATPKFGHTETQTHTYRERKKQKHRAVCAKEKKHGKRMKVFANRLPCAPLLPTTTLSLSLSLSFQFSVFTLGEHKDFFSLSLSLTETLFHSLTPSSLSFSHLNFSIFCVSRFAKNEVQIFLQMPSSELSSNRILARLLFLRLPTFVCVNFIVDLCYTLFKHSDWLFKFLTNHNAKKLGMELSYAKF